MGNLLTSLLHTANSMRVYDRQIATVQNNITNASSPGYVRQTLPVLADRFELNTGLSGGISSGDVVSARDEYAEENVRRQQSLLGQADQKATDLGRLESIFDLTGVSSISGTLSAFFQSFSALSINPNSQIARQSVLDSAGNLAESFNQTSQSLSAAATDADEQARASVDAMNRIAGTIRDLNARIRDTYLGNKDAGIDANAHQALEELSQYANFTMLQQADGTYNVYLGGQTALVVGDHQYDISADFSDPNATRILDPFGNNITGQITTGKLAGQLEERNTLIPGYMADLNTLARTLSDEVNFKLASGVDAQGGTPVIDLFSYNSTIGEAASLSITGISPDQIAAAYPTAPGGNGNALDLAAMVDSKLVNGYTFTEFYGNLGARVGRDLSIAQQQKQTQSTLVAQAHNLRDQVSGVDINEEAIRLIEIQRAYQAAGKVVNVLNEITDTVIGLIR